MAIELLFLISLYTEAVSVDYIPKTGTPPPAYEVAGLAIDSIGGKVYIYGGRSEITHIDMWEFDLTTRRWTEIHSTSWMHPGARSDAFITVREEQREIVLFGGYTDSGPVSDLWIYDIDSESVIFIQWKIVDHKGKAPPKAYFRSVCDYVHNGTSYIAVYGGLGKNSSVKRLFMYCLYRLNLETFTWSELPSLGSAPETLNQRMGYRNGFFYIFTGVFLYKYDFESGVWSAIEPLGKKLNTITDNALCIYEDDLYSILGWDSVQEVPIYSIYKIDLSQELYEMQEISIGIEDMAEWSFGYDCRDNLMYLFGGGSLAGYYNNLAELDLDQSTLFFNQLSKPNTIPNARRGHAMEAYDDQLFIFGGIDKEGNR